MSSSQDAPRPRRDRIRRRVWREWCFARAALRHFRLRFLVMGAVLSIGTLLFQKLGDDPEHSFWRAMFNTWSLVFGEPPAEFPDQPFLQVLYFVIPVLGLTIIIEGIVDFTWMLRDRRRYERNWCLMMASSLKDHIVLVGLGKVGYRTYCLLSRLGERIVIIEQNKENPFLDRVREMGDPLFIGDGRRDQLLHDAHIDRAKSVIVATDDDLANVEIALDARRLNPRIRVVLRMFDQELADKFAEGFNIHLAMSPSAISAPNFAMAAVDPTILSSFVLDDRLIVMVRWTVREGGPLCHMKVGELQRELGFGVAQHRLRSGETRVFPSPDTVLSPGDEVLVQGAYDELVALKSREIGGQALERHLRLTP